MDEPVKPEYPGAVLRDGEYWSADGRWRWNGATWDEVLPHTHTLGPRATAGVPPFGPIRGQSIALLVCLVANLALDVLLFTALLVGIGYATAIQNQTLTEDLSSVAANDGVIQMLSTATLPLRVVTAIAFFMWFHRAYKNLPSIGGTHLSWTPRWTFWGSVIPFMNLVVPFQIMTEVWAASDPATPHSALRSKQSWVIWVWWLTWLAASSIGWFAAFADQHTLGGVISWRSLAAAATVSNFIAGSCLIFLVISIRRRQEIKHASFIDAAHSMPDAWALTLRTLAESPHLATTDIRLANGAAVRYRPLIKRDVARLTEFLASLSATTRRRWQIPSYDSAAAREMCDTVGMHGKVRLIALDAADEILALIELSLEIMPQERARFERYGVILSDTSDIRYAPCVRDNSQRLGIATALMPPTDLLTRRLGRNRMLLSGGVYADNEPAIAFYQSQNFREVGRFESDSGKACIDMVRDVPS